MVGQYNQETELVFRLGRRLVLFGEGIGVCIQQCVSREAWRLREERGKDLLKKSMTRCKKVFWLCRRTNIREEIVARENEKKRCMEKVNEG